MSNHSQIRYYGNYLFAATFAGLFGLAIVLTGCGPKKKYTWHDRLRMSDCQPRTQDVKTKLGGCPKLADPQNPTPEEVREFVDYMNRKDQTEGTMTTLGVDKPGCWHWTINTSGSPEMVKTPKQEGCSASEFQKTLKNYKLP